MLSNENGDGPSLRQVQAAVSDIVERLDAHNREHVAGREAYWTDREQETRRRNEEHSELGQRVRDLERNPPLVNLEELRTLRAFLEEWKATGPERTQLRDRVDRMWFGFKVIGLAVAGLVAAQPALLWALSMR